LTIVAEEGPGVCDRELTLKHVRAVLTAIGHTSGLGEVDVTVERAHYAIGSIRADVRNGVVTPCGCVCGPAVALAIEGARIRLHRLIRDPDGVSYSRDFSLGSIQGRISGSAAGVAAPRQQHQWHVPSTPDGIERHRGSHSLQR
jgi:hypothetical protein